MGMVSVVEAASRLGVGVQRLHQRIADGSLHAERIGSQWVVDELSLIRIAERKAPGRPWSSRSVWAIIALAEGDSEGLAGLAPSERARAKARLKELFSLVADRRRAEPEIRRIASALRLRFRNRADRLLFLAAAADVPDLRQDLRWLSMMSSADSGIASSDVDGYLAASDLAGISRDFLLMQEESDANVVIHLLPPGQRAYGESKLLLAADLADHRGSREELRAVELLVEASKEARQ